MRFVVCLSLFALVQWGSADAMYCVATPNMTSPGAPALPSLPPQFQTRVEATIIDKNFTVSAEEYFDGPNNRATLTMMKMGLLFKLIYDYSNDQLFYVAPDGTCNVGNLTTDNNNMLFGNNMGGSGMPHLYTTNGVLHFAKMFGEKYLGKTTIRGVQVNHWQTCMYWAELKSNFTLDYYFSVPTWITAGGWSQVPIRAEATGVQIQSDGTTSLNFHHIYDYVDFRIKIYADVSMFETPSGVVCPGRVQTRQLPQLKGAFIYREEIIMAGTKKIAQADVWYDETYYKMVRYDFRPQPNTSPYFNTDRATEIHDYNTGVAYAIDRTMGNCTIIPIANASFDTSINITGSKNNPQFVLTMRSPKQIFFLDNTYSYEGQRMSPRGLLCDVFISKVSDFRLQGQTMNATLQFYFLAKDWSESNNIGNIQQKAQDVPVRLDISTAIGFQASYDFYNFAQENPEVTVYDISPCFGDADRISFKLVFYGTFDAPVIAYKKIFLLKGVQIVSEATGVSPVRITNPVVTMKPDTAYFAATLVEKPPSLDKFRKIPDKVLQFRNDATLTYVSTASDCADYCTTYTNFTCYSFDYCPSQQTCSLSKSHTEDGTLVPTPGQCDHYSRTLGNVAKPEIGLQTAWTNLKNAVVKQLVTIAIKYDSGSTVSYTAADIQDSSNSGSSTSNPSTTSTLNQFKAMVNRFVPNYDDSQFTSLSVDECATTCISQDTFVCQSFEYEYATGTCYLSHLHPDEQPKLITPITGVDLYIRDYTSKFAEVPGTTILSSSNVIYQNIYSSNQCAKLCVDLNEFNCKSFDYCDDIGTCFLGKTHYFDAPKSNIQADPMCNHWSRNYLGDFTFNKRKIIPLRDDRVVVGISVAQCAKLCVQEETFSCASFDYCGNYTECRLSSSSTKGVGQVTLESNAYCDIYTRQAFPDGTPFVANYKAYYGPPPKSGGFSAGAMAGLGIAMIIIGVLIALGLVFAYMKFTNKTPDDMKIQFSKHMDSTDS